MKFSFIHLTISVVLQLKVLASPTASLFVLLRSIEILKYILPFPGLVLVLEQVAGIADLERVILAEIRFVGLVKVVGIALVSELLEIAVAEAESLLDTGLVGLVGLVGIAAEGIVEVAVYKLVLVAGHLEKMDSVLVAFEDEFRAGLHSGFADCCTFK